MRVDTQKLADHAAGLQLLARQVAGVQENILHITQVLSQESIGGRFRPALARTTSDTGCCCEDLYHLGTALEQICEAYVLTENRILEEAEYAAVYQVQMEPQVIRLPTLQTAVMTGADGGPIAAEAIDWTPWDPEAET